MPSVHRRPAAVLGIAVLSWLAMVLTGPVQAVDDRPHSLEIDLGPNGVVAWQRGSTPMLRVVPLRGDGWIALARRWCGDGSKAEQVRDANSRLDAPQRDRPVLIPVESVRPDLRLEIVRRLFPLDGRTELGWQHWVLDPFGGGEESWAWLAELFTGGAGSADELRRANPEIAASGLIRGRPIHVPASLLVSAFREVEPPPTPTPTPSPRPTLSPRPSTARPIPTVSASVRGPGPLDFGVDDEGPFAVYRLRRGEALYSAVVVRFTGQLNASQVNETAREIARRSDIEDVTSIPVGFPVKIPLDLLLPQYLPLDDPRRIAWEREERELRAFLEVVRATDLSGVHVVLDAGHGGADSGAVQDGLWEAAYVYDIACRVRRALERHTRATVYMTREDRRLGLTPVDVGRLPHHRDQFLRTRPPYALEDSVIGVHLRWYLTNDIILNRLGDDVPRSKTVFVSIHADSLHPSVRGAMVYVPSRHLRPSSYTVRRQEIRRYAEYRNHPTVRFGPSFTARVEASSRHLADAILGRVRANGIAIHPYEPVRDRVLRGRRSWVPAVLRYTAAQNAVLVEVCNMGNAEDRENLVDHEWREEFARSVVEGISAAFNGD
jgi:N-acetylmuramoyl-L-alanine amidase